MKKIIRTSEAPAAIGPYNQAVQVKDMLFLSGQIPLIPETGEIAREDIQTQTTQVLNNIAAILSAAGYGFENIVKTTIFITDMNLFGEVNQLYAERFTDYFPARSTIAVKALPKNALIEIEAIAVK
ncbi:MAG: RidA family protein [Candidatus Azobacteroides sp.]|nr:RidA family protein [Candidatus Azobacteroides sp.]